MPREELWNYFGAGAIFWAVMHVIFGIEYCTQPGEGAFMSLLLATLIVTVPFIVSFLNKEGDH